MTVRQVAFLRAINVGGRRVKMDDLQEVFVQMKFERPQTYLASGNVTFLSAAPREELERRIASGLEHALGYDVVTFVRTMDDLHEIAELELFEEGERTKRYVTFVASEVDEHQRGVLAELGNEVDQFVARGTEVHWLRHLDAGESLSNMELEAALGVDGTRRTINTVRRIVSKFG